MQLSSQTLSLSEKLNLLADAAKYDVACTSSGVNRAGKQGHLGNSVSCGICHSFSSDGRCISLLKILQSNDCIYDCKYCVNRAGNDRQRATFTPEEVCTLVTEFYRRNYIEGLFLSSAVCKNPAHTMELMYRTLHLLRNRYRFNGYIHVKAIPGAPVELIEKTGYLADRMSVNLELPTGEGLQKLAPQKTQKAILKPMRQIQSGIVDYRLTAGKSAFLERSSGNRYLSHSIFDTRKQISASAADLGWISSSSARSLPEKERSAPFVPAGQSTQMIIGATPENDLQIISVAESLYQKFQIKRVFYSAFVQVNEDAALPTLPGGPPLLREHRLYQADWLMRFYGFEAGELLSEKRPNFNVFLDPKCDWAIGHLEQFPVEVTTADYHTLLRVPGIGVKSAKRIIQARRYGSLSFEGLKKMGVVLKRAIYFITCSGRMYYPVRLEEDAIVRNLLAGEKQDARMEVPKYHQMSLFDDTMPFADLPNMR
mgnify:CR=1 FL=1